MPPVMFLPGPGKLMLQPMENIPSLPAVAVIRLLASTGVGK